MAIAGFCRQCNQNVWCDAAGQLHEWTPGVRGQQLVRPRHGTAIRLRRRRAARQTRPVAQAARDGQRSAVVAEIAQALLAKTGYTVTGGTNTDLVIGSEVAKANWVTGKKKVTYSAIMKAEEADRTVYWWEMLQESGGGLSLGGMGAESYSTFGTKRSGTTKEVVLGPGGVAMDYSWDYAATRHLAEEIAARHGFAFKVVLRKKSAER